MFLMLSTASIELNRFEFDVKSLITDTTTMLCLTDEHQTISFSGSQTLVVHLITPILLTHSSLLSTCPTRWVGLGLLMSGRQSPPKSLLSGTYCCYVAMEVRQEQGNDRPLLPHPSSLHRFPVQHCLTLSLFHWPLFQLISWFSIIFKPPADKQTWAALTLRDYTIAADSYPQTWAKHLCNPSQTTHLIYYRNKCAMSTSSIPLWAASHPQTIQPITHSRPLTHLSIIP